MAAVKPRCVFVSCNTAYRRDIMAREPIPLIYILIYIDFHDFKYIYMCVCMYVYIHMYMYTCDENLRLF